MIILMRTFDHPTNAESADDLLRGDRDHRALLCAAGLFTAAVVLHGIDHARRGADSVDRAVFWTGTAAIALEVAIVVLICCRHRLAPLVAAAGGFSLALGYVVVHFLPSRSWLSDSFVGESEVSALSWAAASLEVVSAIALGTAGAVALRHRGGLASAWERNTKAQTFRSGLTHPIALAMVLGNAAIVTISLAQLG